MHSVHATHRLQQYLTNELPNCWIAHSTSASFITSWTGERLWVCPLVDVASNPSTASSRRVTRLHFTMIVLPELKEVDGCKSSVR